jgi:hypothetical protein
MWMWPGLVRLHARYNSFGRPASMVFHVQLATDAVPADLVALSNVYRQFETSGSPLYLGYSQVRSTNSSFFGCDAWSLGLANRCTHVDVGEHIDGQIPYVVTRQLPTSLAPRVEWLIEGRPMRSPRTYMTGLSSFLLADSTDAEYFDSASQIVLVNLWQLLINLVGGYEGAQLVGVQTRGSPAPRHVLATYPIYAPNVKRGPFGTQRRRTRAASPVIIP